MRLPALIIAATFSLAAAPSADAYWWNGAYGLGIGGLYRSLDFPTENRVPYFASRPPVYYSAPVPRTYGFSPFAYPPSTMTPEIAPVAKPVTIVNPHVEGASQESTRRAAPRRGVRGRTAGATTIEVAAPGPLVIENPFVPNPRSREL
ncbi:MAG: hypothetical protein AAF805_01200 [Planctomycetota bacterium]